MKNFWKEVGEIKPPLFLFEPMTVKFETLGFIFMLYFLKFESIQKCRFVKLCMSKKSTRK